MTGPIRRGERSVSWTARNESIPSSTFGNRPAQLSEAPSIDDTMGKRPVSLPTVPLLSPSEHRMASSPGVLTPDEEVGKSEMQSSRHHVRTPAQKRIFLHTDPVPAHSQLSFSLMEREHDTLDPRSLYRAGFPSKSVPASSIVGSGNIVVSKAPQTATPDTDGVMRKDTLFIKQHGPDDTTGVGPSDRPKIPSRVGSQHAGEKESSVLSIQKDIWGSPFTIEWIRTDRLSFQRTRHLRNPWNHDREVKVSRDGTELEPGVGEALLAEWEKLRTLSPPPPDS